MQREVWRCLIISIWEKISGNCIILLFFYVVLNFFSNWLEFPSWQVNWLVKFIWMLFKFSKNIDIYFYVNKLGKVLPQLHKVAFVEDNFLVEVVWEEIFDEFYNFSIKYFGYGNYLWLIFCDKLFLHRKFRRDLKIVFMISVWNFWRLLSSTIEFWIISKVFRQRKCS